jgi:hypothetical protein
MSEKRYVRICEECSKEYVAKSSKSRFDTVACRSRYHRKKQDSLISTQHKVIKTQADMLNRYKLSDTYENIIQYTQVEMLSRYNDPYWKSLREYGYRMCKVCGSWIHPKDIADSKCSLNKLDKKHDLI